MAQHGLLEVALGLLLEEVAHAAAAMLLAAGRHQDRAARRRDIGPGRAAGARAGDDAVIDAAEGHHDARAEIDVFRQPREAGRDPAAVAAGEIGGGVQVGPGRQGQHDVPRGRTDPQGEAPRRRDAAQGDAEGLGPVPHLDVGGIRRGGRPPQADSKSSDHPDEGAG